MSSDKKKKAWAENGLEDWGAYMAAKKEKLEDQFEDAARKEFQDATALFSGVAIFVNGYTSPCADELKRLMMAHGGIYHHYMRSKITTHIIASNLPYSKIIAYRKSQNPLPICKPEWITDSIREKKLLDWRPYVLYSNCSKSQPPLSFNQAQSNKTPVASPCDPESDLSVAGTAKKAEHAGDSAPPPSTKNPEFLSEFYNNSRLHHISTMGMTMRDYVTELREKSDGKLKGLEALMRQKEEKEAATAMASDSEDDLFDSEESRSAPRLLDETTTIIMHIDMDCFFVSVGLKKHPELKGLPIAVAHARGSGGEQQPLGSMSEIASCSYEARKAGVKNGMFLGQALKLCPKLETIKYDFQGYKEVSYALYDTVASYTLLIEAVSCDEMYADVTNVLRRTNLAPLQFAQIIRNEIKLKTQCPVSTGFGCNKLQARLATRFAKPDGQFHLETENFKHRIGPMSVSQLPGVGYSTMKLLNKINVRTCSDLEKISLSTLKKEFGNKTGESLYNVSRGIDNAKLAIEHVRKSVSAEVNYGIRFENPDEALDFLRKLSQEVCARLQKANCKGRSVTLKLMVRAKDAPKETLKFMGHGICDNFSKSKNLIAPIDDPVVITREVLTLWGQMEQKFEDVRGIGIQISRLESTKSSKKTGGIINFLQEKTKQPEKQRVAPELSVNESTAPAKKTNAEQRIIDESVLAELPEDIKREIFESRVIPAGETTSRTKMKKSESKQKACQQTQQDNYFKNTKSIPGGRATKTTSMPPIEQIDMSVLIELPEDIRNEIINEYRSKKDEVAAPAAAGEQPKAVRAEKNDETNLSFSQIDPEFLAALSDDVKDDVEMYCMIKKKEQLAAVRTRNNGNELVGKNNRISGRINKNKNPPSNKTKKKTGNDFFKAAPNNRKIASCCCSTSVEISTNSEIRGDDEKNERFLDPKCTNDGKAAAAAAGASLEQTQEIISHHSSFIGNKKTRTEEQEMVTSLVNYLFTLPRRQVQMQIQRWISKSADNVNEIDLLSLATFLSMLPKKKRLEDLHVLLKSMHRCIVRTASCVWHETYVKTVSHVQHYMNIEYQSKLMLPEIECARCQSTISKSYGTMYNE